MRATKHARMCAAAFGSSLAIAFIIFLLANAAAQRKPAAEPTALFAVHKYEADVMIDPVAVITSGRYAEPPIGAETRAEMSRFKHFIGNYYRPGRKYRMLFGGGEAGTLEVRKFIEPGCVGMEASATAQTSVRLGGQVMALATNSPTLGKGAAGTRRAPTEQERAAALEIARKSFHLNKVAEARVSKMETNNLTAIDLNRDGHHELVGSFIITGEFGIEDALFIIAEPSASQFTVTLRWFHHGQEADATYRRLVDALDLDGDGTAEVIAQGIYYESHDYFIYKKQNGVWSVIYQGAGGGC